MWAILKINPKQIQLLQNDFEKKINEKIKFYIPKTQLESFISNKKKTIQYSVLGDYIFCFSLKFINKNVIISLKYSKGLKYFLNGFENSQSEINKFIKICKNSENENGFLTQNFFKVEINKYYKFLNGPFVSQIFQILEIQKKQMSLKIGQFKSYINRKDILFKPI